MSSLSLSLSVPSQFRSLNVLTLACSLVLFGERFDSRNEEGRKNGKGERELQGLNTKLTAVRGGEGKERVVDRTEGD